MIFLIIGSQGRSRAQTDMHGTEFWCSFMNNEMGNTTGRFYITAVQNATVTIENSFRNFKMVVNVQANKLTYCDIPDSIARPRLLEKKERTGLHILSDKPVCITAALFEVHASNAFVVIPLKNVSVGEKFIAAHGLAKSKNQIQLLATEDSVVFKVNLVAGSTGKHKSNVPFTLILNQGESYSVVADTGDFSGSVVEILNKKKGLVYIGDKNLATHYGGCAHRSIVTQLNSIDWSDRRFVVMPLFGQTKGYKLKCVSLDTHLWVTVNGYSHFITNRDSSIELDILNGDSVLLVTADRPFLCFQIMKGGGKNGFYKLSSGGHPGIIQIAGSSHLTNESHFVSLTNTKIKDHFVSILIDKRSRDAVTLDQHKIPPEDFLVVPDDTNYYYVNRLVNEGAHLLRSSYGHQVYAYGIEVSSIAESYFYFAGFKYPVIKSKLADSTVAYDCRNNRIYSRIKTDLNNPYNLPVKQVKWFSDSFTVKDGAYFFDAPFVAGQTYRFTVLIYYEGYIDTLEEQFTFNFPEFNPVYDFTLCRDSVIFKIDNPYFSQIRWNDNSTARSYNAKKEEKVLVSARDTSGYCSFSDSADVQEVQFVRRMFIDTLSDCHVNNLFRIRDESTVLNDSIRLRVWNFKGAVIAYDTNLIEYHFDQPGKPVLHLDLYLQTSQKKCRMEIPFRVHWNTYTRADFGGERFCTGDTVTVVDKSFPCCDSIATYSVHSDGMSITSKLKTQQFQITFDPIPGTGFKTYYYVVTNDKGCKDTMKKEIIVMPDAEAKISQNDSVQKCKTLARWNFIHNRNESLTGPYAVKWFFGDSAMGENDAYRNYRFTKEGIHAVKLKTQTGFGCIDSSITYVSVLPEIEASISPDTNFACLVVPELEFTVRAAHPLPITYSWFKNNDSIGSDSSIIIQHAFENEFKISLMAKSENPYCQTALLERWVNYRQNPQASMQLSDSVLCAETEFTTALNTSAGNRPAKTVIWKWDGKRDTIALLKDIGFDKPGVYSIKLQITDTAGCVDSVIRTVEVFDPKPITIVIDDSVLCESQDISALAMHQAPKIKWFLNRILLADTTDNLVLGPKPSGVYGLKVMSISAQGCPSADSTTFRIKTAPIAGFTLSDDTACFDAYNLEVKNTAFSPDDPILAYTYRSDAGILGNNVDFTLSKNLRQAVNVITQTVITQEGCIDSFSREVFLLDWLPPSITGDTICVGETALLTAVGMLQPGVVRMLWHSGDGYRVEGTVLNHVYPYPGKYSPLLEIFSKEGCVAADTLIEGMVVYPTPIAKFTSKSIQQDDNVLLELLADGNPDDVNTWTVGSNGVYSGNSVRVGFDKGFTDYVKLLKVNRFGCADSIREFIEVYPLVKWQIPSAFSPGNDYLNNGFGLVITEGVSEFHFRIYNRWGELLFYSNNPAEKWNGLYKGALVQPGIYTYLFDFTYGKTSKQYINGTVHVVR